MRNLHGKIFQNYADIEFQNPAIEIFQYQYVRNPVYHRYVDLLNINPEKVKTLETIPFLPISFFKSHTVITGNEKPELYFQSSGTTGQIRSKHYVTDIDIYIQSFKKSFAWFYGNFEDYCFLALLPSYLEQQHSSLVYMMDYFISRSSCRESAFFLNDFEKLATIIDVLEAKGQKTILFGVSYALMDFAEFYNKPLKSTIVMETGGMKGRREELTKRELHHYLEKFLKTPIHSEYGMTELLSQAYSQNEGKFFTPPWMKILIRDRYDPFTFLPAGKTGGINIIDLANVNSCSFIETQDLGKTNPDNSFELHGRFDVADIRGCNLLLEQ